MLSFEMCLQISFIGVRPVAKGTLMPLRSQLILWSFGASLLLMSIQILFVLKDFGTPGTYKLPARMDFQVFIIMTNVKINFVAASTGIFL